MKTTGILYFGILLSVLAKANLSAIPKEWNVGMPVHSFIDNDVETTNTTNNLGSSVSKEKITPTGCYIRVNGDMNGPMPIFTSKGSLTFLPSNISGIVVLNAGESFDMHCTSYFNVPFQKYKQLTATCVSNLQFTVHDDEYHFNAFSCMDWPSFEARRSAGKCDGGSELVEVGFPLNAGFLRTFSVCHENELGATHYAQHELIPANVRCQIYLPEQKFLSGDFYDSKDIDNLYSDAQQNATLSALLGLDASKTLLQKRLGYYLVAGQLAGRENFIFSSAQRSTYLYINTAPQWRSVYAGNWRSIDLAVRDFVADNNINAKIYTGTWAIATLPAADGQQRALFLDADGYQLPVPKIFYRIVIDQATRKGIVLIAVNNPHATLNEILQNYVICDDVGDRLNWIEWHKTRLSNGYAYACAVDDFLETVKDLPYDDLQTSGLLGVDEDTTTSTTIPTTTVSL